MDARTWITQTVCKTPAEIETLTHIPKRTTQSQIARNNIPAENIITISEAVGLNPITELVRFGHLNPRWIDDANPLDTISDEELCYELMRRMRNHAFMSGDVG